MFLFFNGFMDKPEVREKGDILSLLRKRSFERRKNIVTKLSIFF